MMHPTSCGALNCLWPGGSILKRLKKKGEYNTISKSLKFLRWFLRIYATFSMFLALGGIMQVFFSDTAYWGLMIKTVFLLIWYHLPPPYELDL